QNAAHVTDWPQLGAGHDTERYDGRRMTVHDRHHILAFAIDFTVNETFEIACGTVWHDRIAVEIELQHILHRHQCGCHAARQQKAPRPFGVPYAHMPKTVHHALVEQDVVGVDQFADRRLHGLRCGLGHGGPSLRLYAFHLLRHKAAPDNVNEGAR